MYQCHDRRNCRQIMAPDGSNVRILATVVRLLTSALMPRSLVRVVKIMLPDGSNVTILVTVVTFLFPGWMQCHDPRNCRQSMALWMDPMPRSSAGANENSRGHRRARGRPGSLPAASRQPSAQPGAQPPDPPVETVLWDSLVPPLEPSSETLLGNKALGT